MAKPQEKKSILIVDDNPSCRLVIRQALQNSGFLVTEADCSQRVYELLFDDGLKPDLILLDIKMPGENGIDVCQKIRQSKGWQGTPIMMVTANEDHHSIDMAYKAGATDFITKPINVDLIGYRALYLVKNGGQYADLVKNRSHLINAKKIAKISEWTWDIQNESLFWSDELYKLIGLDNKIRVASHNFILSYVHDEDKQAVSEYIQKLFEHNISDSEIEYKIVNSKSEIIYVQERAQILLDDNNQEPSIIIGTIQDITQNRNAEEKIRYLAYHDSLTDLPNRASFEENLQQAIHRAGRNNHKLAVMLLDLDDFKRINDTLGHDIGDALLRTVSHRLHQCLRDTDIIGRNIVSGDKTSKDSIARLGGDEFILLLENNIDPSYIPRLCQRIISSINSPINLDSHSITMGVSIGIALYPLDAMEPIGLVKYADIAMYTAKSSGKNKFQFYDSDMNKDAYRHFKIETEMRKDDFSQNAYLVYQPKIDINNHKTVCFEALMRWQHAELGLLMPGEFIPIAETCGAILPIGEWVIKEACKQTRLWHLNNHKVDISVNLSACQFENKDIVDIIKSALHDSQLNPQHMIVEITEGMLMQDFDHAADILCALKDIGVRVYLDDFGTGYSSLKYLSIFPVDGLKIDRSFVQNLPENENDATITKTIIALAKNLNVNVIAEGVETTQQLKFLQENHCDQVQGFYFAQPMNAAAATDFLKQRTTLNSA